MAPLPKVPRQLHSLRPVKAHPSRGGSTGYSAEFRQAELNRYYAGDPITVSKGTIENWTRRIDAFVQTGNKANHALSGEYETLLVFHRLVFPRATADEAITFIAKNSVVTKIFDRGQIYDADKRLGLTKKKCSLTAFQALTPHNLARRRLYWTAPPPVGIAGVPLASLVDMDECAIHLNCANRTHGKSVIGVRVRDAGHYQRSDKWTLILAIDAQGFTHVRLTKDVGTTKLTFDEFIRTLLPRLPAAGGPRTLIWDNLSSHYSDVAATMIYNAGHQVVPRPPYRPQDGPIEYIFNQLEGKLRTKMYQIHNDGDLVVAVHNSIAELSLTGGFRNTFLHCGYR
jgi:hypothetical protein